MTKQLEVGKTYTAEDGTKWRCIAVYGGTAHMRSADSAIAPAYAWTRHGYPTTFGSDKRIVFEPERGEVVLDGQKNFSGSCWRFESNCIDQSHTHRLRIPTLDGELATGTYVGPDGHRIKVEKL